MEHVFMWEGLSGGLGNGWGADWNHTALLCPVFSLFRDSIGDLVRNPSHFLHIQPHRVIRLKDVQISAHTSPHWSPWQPPPSLCITLCVHESDLHGGPGPSAILKTLRFIRTSVNPPEPPRVRRLSYPAVALNEMAGPKWRRRSQEHLNVRLWWKGRSEKCQQVVVVIFFRCSGAELIFGRALFNSLLNGSSSCQADSITWNSSSNKGMWSHCLDVSPRAL